MGSGGVRRTNGSFEVLNRDDILAGAKLKGEMGRGVRKDSERTGITRSKWRKGRISTDENVRSVVKSSRNGKRRRGRSRNMMLSRRGGKEGGGRKEGGGKGRRGWKGISKELGRKSEIHPIDSLGRRNVGVFSRGGAEAEKDPGKMMKPVSCGGASPESGFEAAVKVLDQIIGLGMIGSGRLMGDVKETTQVKPKSRCKLGTTIRGDNGRNTKSGDPGMDESRSTVDGGSGGERNSFRPVGGTVNHRKEVCLAGGRGERTNQINMNVRKPLSRNRNMLRRDVGVAVDFGSLTGETGVTPGSDVTRKMRPDIKGGNEAAGSMDARMSQIMNVVENQFT